MRRKTRFIRYDWPQLALEKATVALPGKAVTTMLSEAAFEPRERLTLVVSRQPTIRN